MADPHAAAPPLLEVRGLTVSAGPRTLLRNVSLTIAPGRSMAVIGPSGVGKSTLLRCLNRLIVLTPGVRVEGDVLFHGRSLHGSSVDLDALRARIGILFQQPVVFPGTIRDNVLFGVKRMRTVPKSEWAGTVELALADAALWDEVRDRLDDSASKLSVGQKQRLCLARTLAVGPEVLLLDEPTSALDARSVRLVESSLDRLRSTRTLVLVTHRADQARRLAEEVTCLARRDDAGEVAWCGPCDAWDARRHGMDDAE